MILPPIMTHTTNTILDKLYQAEGLKFFGKLIYMILMMSSIHRNQMILRKQTV